MPLGTIPLNSSITSADISDFAEGVDDRVNSLLVAGTNITFNYNDVANTLTINSAGGGGGSFVDSVADTSTLDLTVATGTLSGQVTGIAAPSPTPDVTVYRSAAGRIRVERPTGSPVLDIRAVQSGQSQILQFTDNATERWRVSNDAGNILRVIDQANGATNFVSYYPVGNVNDIAHEFGNPSTWDAAASGSATGGKIRSRWYYPAGGRTNATSGSRGESVQVDSVLSGSFTHFWSNYHNIDHDSKGAFAGIGILVVAKKPVGGTYPNTYNETAGVVLHTISQNKGGLVECWETLLEVRATGDGGPARAHAGFLNVAEDNPYTDYTSGNLGSGSQYINTGARALTIFSSGTKRLGTGIQFVSSANTTDEAAGETGFVRLVSVIDTTGAEVACWDGFGRLGLGAVRNQSSNTAGLPAWLNFGASTLEAGGINFGGDVELYRIAANVLKLKDGFAITSAAGSADPIGGGTAGVYFSNAGRMDIGRNSATLEVMRVYGVAGDANARFIMLGNGQMNWQRADGTNDVNIEPDSTTAMTGLKIGTAITQKLGFWNATPVAQPTVTGSRGGNAALASLLTQLASTGLVVDSTTA